MDTTKNTGGIPATMGIIKSIVQKEVLISATTVRTMSEAIIP
jgi:hypothetical protein